MKKADLARGVRLFEEFRHDLRYGTRLLAKNPGVSLIAILTLAGHWRQHRHLQRR